MKRALWIIFILISALFLAADLYAQSNADEEFIEEYRCDINADTLNYDASAVNKLGRGLINTATFWAEIPTEMLKTSKNSDPFMGCTLGLVKGVFTSVLRGVTGVYDTLTFFVPPYDKPAMKPEYAIESTDKKFKEYLW